MWIGATAAPSPARCWLSQMLIASMEPSLRGHRAHLRAGVVPPGPRICECGGDSVTPCVPSSSQTPRVRSLTRALTITLSLLVGAEQCLPALLQARLFGRGERAGWRWGEKVLFASVPGFLQGPLLHDRPLWPPSHPAWTPALRPRCGGGPCQVYSVLCASPVGIATRAVSFAHIRHVIRDAPAGTQLLCNMLISKAINQPRLLRCATKASRLIVPSCVCVTQNKRSCPGVAHAYQGGDFRILSCLSAALV